MRTLWLWKNKEAKFHMTDVTVLVRSNLFWLTLQHVYLHSPLQSDTIAKFHGANIVASVFFLCFIYEQWQISFYKARDRSQSSASVWLPSQRIIQREGEEPLWITRNVTQACVGEVVPVHSLDALSFDLFPGDARGNGTGDGERLGFRGIQRTCRSWGEV